MTDSREITLWNLKNKTSFNNELSQNKVMYQCWYNATLAFFMGSFMSYPYFGHAQKAVMYGGFGMFFGTHVLTLGYIIANNFSDLKDGSQGK